jgi:histidine ammonia-lyase
MDNLERILAIELMNASQAINLEDRFSQVSLSKMFWARIEKKFRL